MDQGGFLSGSLSGYGPYDALGSSRQDSSSALTSSGGSDSEEDIHVCGHCKLQFDNIEDFVRHKKSKGCAKKKKKKKRKKISRHSNVPAAPPELLFDGGALLDAALNHTHGEEEEEERNAEEAAVISLLANQLSNNQKPIKALLDRESIELPEFGDDYFDTIANQEANDTIQKTIFKIRSGGTVKKGKKASKINSPAMRKLLDVKNSENISKSSSKVKSFSCGQPGCEFASTYSKDLTRHMRKHTGEKPFQCSFCSKFFSRQDKLRNHERIHTGSKPFKCQFCEYRCTEASSLTKHIRVHTNERPYPCQICTYKAKDHSQLKVHLRTHTGDCPFICTMDNCSSSFKTNSDLKRHIRTHTGEKPFGCSYCPFRCAIKSNLTKHVASNHKDVEGFTCSVCKEKFAKVTDLKLHEESHNSVLLKCKSKSCKYSTTCKVKLSFHERKLHTNKASFSCPYCYMTCKWEGALSAHINKKHGRGISKLTSKKDGAKSEQVVYVGANKPVLTKSNCLTNFTCAFCPASFVRKDSYQSHMRQHPEHRMAENEAQMEVALQQEPCQSVNQYVKSDPVMGSAVILQHNNSASSSSDSVLPTINLSSPAKLQPPLQHPIFLTNLVSLGNAAEHHALPFKIEDQLQSMDGNTVQSNNIQYILTSSASPSVSDVVIHQHTSSSSIQQQQAQLLKGIATNLSQNSVITLDG